RRLGGDEASPSPAVFISPGEPRVSLGERISVLPIGARFSFPLESGNLRPVIKRRVLMLARAGRFIVLIAAASAAASHARGQSIQYRSPAGVAYRSQPDTGAIARAQTALAGDPGNPQRFVDLAVAQSGVRQFREAIQTL